MSVAELSGRTVNYGYDDLYRLTSETIGADSHGNNGQVSYTFDNVGNRLQRNSTLPAIPATGLLNYDANDRTSTDPYDANGNLLNGGAGSNVYDFENHLVAAGGVSVVYDDGNRVKETVATTTTSFLVADQNLTGYTQVLDELQGGAVSRTYSYGLSLISQKLTANGQGLSFYGFDGHGSVRFLLSSTGAITDSYDYDAFGNLISQTGSTPNNYLFAGEQFDPALGIYYNRARYYDQRQGRFWTMDTKDGRGVNPLSLHRYSYAAGNPVNLADPTGLDFDLGSLSESQAISETVETVESPERALQVESKAKIATIYWAFGLGNFGGGGKLFGIVPIPHAYIFADVSGGQSERFDVALDEEEGATLGSAIITTVPGFINVQPATLAEVRADSLLVVKSASLSVLEYGFWRAGLPAVASGTNSLTAALDTVIDELPIEYQAFAQGGINCISFTIGASLAAKGLQNAPF